MTHHTLYGILVELDAFAFGNRGMFDDWLDETIWKEPSDDEFENDKARQKQLKQKVMTLSESEAQKEIRKIVGILDDYDVEDTGMFDDIVEIANQRNTK